ncbi:MAG: DUF134 domain-containing protein [Candidatus Altiarchaeota archaeon]|nr:DUF134 domain-containing protein [Candidatus Altiarchaeota archaeon]
MPRRRCRRWVRYEPEVSYFKPAGIPKAQLETIPLLVEEYEAVRLADFKGKSQSAAAKEMGVSQPTFHRMLVSARKKVSDALINGKAIKIEGGHYVVTAKRGGVDDTKDTE